jgi:hypothetical protein
VAGDGCKLRNCHLSLASLDTNELRPFHTNEVSECGLSQAALAASLSDTGPDLGLRGDVSGGHECDYRTMSSKDATHRELE